MFDFKSLRNTVESVNKKHADLQQQIATIETKVSQMRSAPLSKSDLHDMADRWVQSSASGLTPVVASYLSGRFRSVVGGLGVPEMRGFSVVKDGHGELSPEVLEGMLCAAFGANIKQALHKAIDEIDWPGAGLPLGKRQAEIERLSDLAQELRVELEKLLDDAHEAGIKID